MPKSINSISQDKILLKKAKKEIEAKKYVVINSPKELENYLLKKSA